MTNLVREAKVVFRENWEVRSRWKRPRGEGGDVAASEGARFENRRSLALTNRRCDVVMLVQVRASEPGLG